MTVGELIIVLQELVAAYPAADVAPIVDIDPEPVYEHGLARLWAPKRPQDDPRTTPRARHNDAA